jgi:surfeit locus 1 family protein
MREASEARDRLPALGAEALSVADDALPTQVERAVTLRGRWLSERTIYLDNRPLQGRFGFIVVTPLQLEGRDAAVLVQRGWVPRDIAERTRLPRLDDVRDILLIKGRIAASPSRVYEIGEAGTGPIRQNLDRDAYARETGLKLLAPTIVQLAPAELDGQPLADGLSRDWPAPDLGLQKHYGYAFQWFALSALIVFLYVWFQIVRPRRRRPSA